MLDRLREIERDLGVSPVTTTMTAAASDHDSGAVTKLLPGSTSILPVATTPAAAEAADNGTRLRRRTATRRARGALLQSLVLLLAVTAGGVGWWFGSGPGSLIAVPQVTGMALAEAQSTITSEGLTPATTEKSSVEVPKGEVIDTDPGEGERVEKESTVTLIVSSGPAKHTVGELSGLTEEKVRQTLVANHVNVDENVEEYFAALEKGLVLNVRITPRAGGDVYGCGDGCELFEDDDALIQVSLGAVPDVTGKELADAKRILGDARLKVDGKTPEQWSDSIPKGSVISQTADRPGGGSWRPGDTVTLTVSKGPQLFAVPDVAGLTRDEAAKKLEDAGFTVDYAPFWNGVPNGLTKAQSTDPEAGAMRRKGTEIYVVLNVSG
jgi:serine/threonine-protein kinase